MNNIQIKTKVYTNAIIEEIRRVSGKTIHYFGIVSCIVKDILSDEKTLDAIVTCAWDENEKQGVCVFTPEQLLELAPHGFNPCPIELFLNGSMSLKDAIEECFSVTMSSVWDADEWAENSGDGLEKLDFDLFECTCGNRKEEKWLATDKEGTPLCELCPDCRENATKEEKNGQTKSN